MNADEYRKVKAIFHSVLDIPAAERAGFLDEKCTGDLVLRREVERLLDSHESGYLEHAAVEDVAKEIAADGFMTGQRVGHYNILKKIGAGGMGEVYLAEDQKLGRRVAIKVLPEVFTKDEDRLRRFNQEARTASALNHPNILTIHEIGEIEGANYIATEYIDGETLRSKLNRERLTISESLEIAVQTASALAAAHEAGIVHRDIKPENIMLRRDNLVKVLDFGLAKLVEKKDISISREAMTERYVKTAPGVIMGTVQYMSPEQTRGHPTDARTDIWSLGVVIYEMAAGQPPFAGENTADLIAEIVKTYPVPVSHTAEAIPERLDEIVAKTLEKDPDERYQTAKDLLIDLKRLKRKLDLEAEVERSHSPAMSGGTDSTSVPQTAFITHETADTENRSRNTVLSAAYIVSGIQRHKFWAVASAGLFIALVVAAVLTDAFSIYRYDRNSSVAAIQPIKTIAVLPLKSLSSNSGDEELRLRITDALITRLGGLSDIVTRPTDSVLRFSKSEQSILEIGKKLNVDAVLDGRVQQEGENLRVTLQLVSVADGKQIWSEQFDGEADQILSLQDAISARVLQTINMGRPQKLEFPDRPTQNTEAYEEFLKARYFATRINEKDFLRAIDLYKRATELDPQFAQSYVGLASTQYRLYSSNIDHNPDNISHAKQNLQKALVLQPDLASALVILGNIQMSVDWDWENAENNLKRAVEIEPNSVFARNLYGAFLTNVRRFDEARFQLEQAIRLNPIDSGSISSLGRVYLCEKDFVKAEGQFRRALEFNEKWTFAHWFLARISWSQGRKEESIKYIISGLESEGNEELARKIEAKTRASDPDQVIRFLTNEWNTAKETFPIAIWLMNVAERQQALVLLEKSFEDHHPWTILISSTPEFEPLWEEPRFQAILRKMNLR